MNVPQAYTHGNPIAAVAVASSAVCVAQLVCGAMTDLVFQARLSVHSHSGKAVSTLPRPIAQRQQTLAPRSLKRASRTIYGEQSQTSTTNISVISTTLNGRKSFWGVHTISMWRRTNMQVPLCSQGQMKTTWMMETTTSWGHHDGLYVLHSNFFPALILLPTSSFHTWHGAIQDTVPTLHAFGFCVGILISTL